MEGEYNLSVVESVRSSGSGDSARVVYNALKVQGYKIVRDSK